MKKKLSFVAIGIAAVVLAGCGAQEAQVVELDVPITTVENTQPTQIENTSENTTENTIGNTVENTTENTTENITTSNNYADPSTEVIQDGRSESEVTNGEDSTIHAPVKSIINLSSELGNGYEVGNITILSGDSVSVLGKDAVITEKEGTSVIECTLYDNETDSIAKTQIKVVVE